MSKKCIAFVALFAAGVATAQETDSVFPLEVAETSSYDVTAWDSARPGDTVAPATGSGRVSSSDPDEPLNLIFDDSYDFAAEHDGEEPSHGFPTHTPSEGTEMFDAPHPAFEPYVKWAADTEAVAPAPKSPTCQKHCAALRKKAACCKRKCAAKCKRARCARVCAARAAATAPAAWGEREFNRELQSGRAFGVRHHAGGAHGEEEEEEEEGEAEWGGRAHVDGGADEDAYGLEYSDDAELPAGADRDDEALFFPGFGFGGLRGGLVGGIGIGGIGIGGAIGGGVVGGGVVGGGLPYDPYGGQFQGAYDPKFGGGQLQGGQFQGAYDPKFGGFGGVQQGGAVIAAPPQAGFGGGFFGGGGGFGGFGGPRFF